MGNIQNNQWSNQWKDFLNVQPELILSEIHPLLPSIPNESAESIAKNEEFWNAVKTTYPQRGNIINLNNGAVSSSPLIVQQAFTTYYELVNKAPSYYLWKVMESGKELIRQGIANLIGAGVNEIAMLRNTTESLNNIIFGVPLKAGDEVIVCKQDYSKAVSSWKQRELREGIKLVWVDLDLPNLTEDEIIKIYISKINNNTRFVHLTHVINWNGQVLPVKEIIKQVKQHNLDVLLDGAHAFSLIETDVRDLNCDYYVAPLHKWLNGPITSGMLFAKQEKIAGLWPMASAANPQSDDIRKLEELSLVLSPMFLAIGYAIDFHLQLGQDNKQLRLREVRKYWYNQVKGLKKIKWLSPAEEESRICIILNFNIEGLSPESIEQTLIKDYNIHVGLVTWENLKGVRITPNIYTSYQDLDLLAQAIKKLAS